VGFQTWSVTPALSVMPVALELVPVVVVVVASPASLL
jgi:hypothetical protein